MFNLVVVNSELEGQWNNVKILGFYLNLKNCHRLWHTMYSCRSDNILGINGMIYYAQAQQGQNIRYIFPKCRYFQKS